jgi:hypothetical protein
VAGFMAACGKLFAESLLVFPGRYFIEPMVLYESRCGLGKNWLKATASGFQFSHVLLPCGCGVRFSS